MLDRLIHILIPASSAFNKCQKYELLPFPARFTYILFSGNRSLDKFLILVEVGLQRTAQFIVSPLKTTTLWEGGAAQNPIQSGHPRMVIKSWRRNFSITVNGTKSVSG